MPDIIITPSSGIIDFFPASTRVGRIEGSGNTINVLNPSGYVVVSGSGISINSSTPNSTLFAYSATSGATILNIEGTNGSLFSIVDNLSGSLMSVNNNAGLPVFEVFSDDRIVAGRFGQNDFIMTSGGNIGIGTGVPSSKFHVVGNSTFNGNISSTGSIITGSGSASNPSFEFINDIDTGLFSPAANVLGISTSGVERLRINNSGLIGIGTTTPTSQFHVIGTGNFTQALQLNGTGISISGHSHTVSDITNFGSGVSGLLPTIANSGDNRVLTSTGSTLGINAEANLTFDGTNLSAPYLLATYASGDEGGEIQLTKPPNGTLAGGVTIDAYQNRLRFFEQGGSARGFYLDISSGGAGASTNIGGGGGGAAAVSNYGDNRILTSDGTTTGLNAETNFTFNGSLLTVTGSGIFSSGLNVSGSLNLNGSGVGLYDTSVLSLGTISGTNSINCGQDRQIQTLTLNGVATTLTKGSNWPSTSNVSRDVTLNIYASGNTSVTWTLVTDWYRQPDSPLPSGNHVLLLRGVGSSIIQGHYIGSKTN